MNSNKRTIIVHTGALLGTLLSILLISCSDKNPVSPNTQYGSLIEYAKTETQKTRGLQFIRPVNVGFLTRKQFSSYNDSWSSGSSASILKEFKQIGFIPDTFKNTNFLESHSDNFAAAFYKTGTDSLYIIDPESNSDEDIFIYTVHELTHALQEQHFNAFSNGIYPSVLQSTLNSDFYISQLCVSEGDASLNMILAFYNLVFPNAGIDSTRSYFRNYCDSYYSGISSESIPRYLNIQGYAPYTIGAWFTLTAYGKGGWPNVNSLYHANRVNSTANVINSNHEIPYTFDFSKIMPMLLKSTTKLVLSDDDTYGPVMLMALLNELVDTAHCKKAFGWQGDRLLYTLSDNQTYGSLVWAMKFITTDDAIYMQNIMDKFLSSRKLSGLASTRTVDSTGAITFLSANASTLLTRNGSILLWLENITQKDSIVTMLTQSALTKRSTTLQSFSTVSTKDKHKFIDRLFGFTKSESVQKQIIQILSHSNQYQVHSLLKK